MKIPNPTLKNAMVYDFLRTNLGKHDTVKGVYLSNREEISREFGINTYQTFAMHVRRSRQWERSTGNKITVVRDDERGIQSNGDVQD